MWLKFSRFILSTYLDSVIPLHDIFCQIALGQYWIVIAQVKVSGHKDACLIRPIHMTLSSWEKIAQHARRLQLVSLTIIWLLWLLP